MNPVVSAIMPFLAARAFIAEAIESVLAQTYDAWELLLVDDGSTDGTREIALRYAEADPGRIRLLQHEGRQNQGASASRNLGITSSRGDYIAFLDADDVWLPEKFQRQVSVLASQPEAAMLCGATEYWYSWSGAPEDAQRDFVRPLGIPTDMLVRPPRLLTLTLRQKAAVPCTCSLLVRRRAVEEVGGFEASLRNIFEDQSFYAKICLSAPVFVASGCWDRYRRHPHSSVVMARRSGHSRDQRLAFLSWLEEFMAERAIQDPDVWSALRAALRPYRHPILYRLSRRARHLAQRTRELLTMR